MQKLSEEFNMAVVITNHVISDPGGGAMFVADPKKAAGGHVMAHYVRPPSSPPQHTQAPKKRM